MIKAKDYNCREQGECYLTYRRRLARENEEYLNNRVNTQTTEEWYAEYDRTSKAIRDNTYYRDMAIRRQKNGMGKVNQ